jgi:ABC-type branched-subunit amino acid transport system ATPase component
MAEGRVLAIGDPHEVLRSSEVIEVYLGKTFDMEGDV